MREKDPETVLMLTVPVPKRILRTISTVALSAPNEERSESTAVACVVVRPVVEGAETAGVVGVTGVISTTGATVTGAGVVDTVGVDEPPVEPPPLPLLVEEQSTVDGVIVTVTFVFGEYPITDWFALQMSVDTPVSVLAENRLRFGAVTLKDEPDCIVTLKSVALTVIDSMVALVPETFSVMLFTLRTVSVVSVTSLNAASAAVGARSATSIPARASIRCIVSLFN